MNKKCDAKALITGKDIYKEIIGKAYFYNTNNGVLVVMEVNGLPKGMDNCSGRIYGVHIHEGNSCTGNESDMFANTKSHYNPNMCMHPYHAGDMPPLFESNGHALMMFLSNRFTIDEIVNKTIVIHDKPDDFTTQPSGNSGNKIACGVIVKSYYI